MDCCKTVYSKEKKRKAWRNFSNENVNKKCHLTSTCKFWCQLKQKYKYNYANFKITHPFSLTFPSNFLSLNFCVFILSCDCISSESLINIAYRIYEDIQKQALRVVLYNSCLARNNQNHYTFLQNCSLISIQFIKQTNLQFIKNEILHRYFSRDMVKRSIFQLYRVPIFLQQL